MEQVRKEKANCSAWCTVEILL